jgi:hypothetical protein
VAATIFPIGVRYSHVLRPELADRWEQLYGAGVESVSVVAFAAEVSEADLALDSNLTQARRTVAEVTCRACLSWEHFTKAHA